MRGLTNNNGYGTKVFNKDGFRLGIIINNKAVENQDGTIIHDSLKVEIESGGFGLETLETINIQGHENQAFELNEIDILIEIPLKDIHGYWLPARSNSNHIGPGPRLDWELTLPMTEVIARVAPNFGMPAIAFVNREMNNRFFCGLVNHSIDTEVKAKLSLKDGAYIVSFRRPLSGEITNLKSWVEKLFISTEPQPWFEVLNQYHRIYQEINPSIYQAPAAAFAPTYCTWYSGHANINEGWVEEQAKQAAELGFGSIILDDGWFDPEIKMVGHNIEETINIITNHDESGLGRNVEDWYSKTGDYFPEPSKFPDFAKHVKRVQAMGLKYILWVAPLLVGPESSVAESLNEYLVNGSLCVRKERVHEFVIEKLKFLLLSTGVDGFKIDFIDHDHTACCYHNEHDYETSGQGIEALLSKIVNELRKIRPDLMLEFRQKYINFSSKAFATQFRVVDVPFDYDQNRRNFIQVKSILGPGVAVHSDPAHWRLDDSLENVSRHMIASIFAVPQVSVNLCALPTEQKQIIKVWLDFYKDNKDLITNGVFKPVFINGDFPIISLEDETTRLVGVFGDNISLSNLGSLNKNIIIINSSNGPWWDPLLDGLECHYKIYDQFMKVIDNGKIPVGGILRLFSDNVKI